MLLSIKNISKRYKNGIDALSDVSLDVEKGEFISIIGPSGSGKSTLLRSINKMIDVTSGSIYFENHDITNMKKKKLKISAEKWE
ncbi:ATP-binding cassette domain-containing protein [Leptotrichia sp. oral taxon 218]|uniref:ATP-binding cassette domain-containing protein n=1 Tax=Leptotrichia sp. oral taxon 218 TaxID=712361 RepID=UPI00211374AE|nr:ATP-binding cassette domain-containing protein [Leptotrichia sp. oral taxon 218]